MSNKTWLTTTEWIGHAPCGEKIDFIKEPAVLGPRRAAVVRATCASCLVRPECIDWATTDRFVTDAKGRTKRVGGAEHSVWVAGEWLPDTGSAASRRDLEVVRARLVRSLPGERDARDDNLL